MKRLTTTGLIALAVLALTAVGGVASASASKFKTPGAGTTSLTGTRVGIKNHNLTLGTESLSCSKVGFSGQTSGTEAPSVTVTPELGECSLSGLGVSWAINGCKYRLNPGVGSGTSSVGTIDIVSCEKPMTLAYETCRVEIGNQSGVGTVEYTTTSSEKHSVVSVSASLGSITYTRNSGGCFGGAGTFHDGVYTGGWTVKGTASGTQVNFEVEGTSAPKPTHFSAEESPVTVAALNTGMSTRLRLGTAILCNKYALNGTSESTTPETISLKPTYSECTFGSGGPAIPDENISAGGCNYVFHVSGTVDIAGVTCASNPISITTAGCVRTIGPQSGLPAGLTFKNEGSGKLRTVSMTGVGTPSLSYTAVGAGCALGEGTFTGTVQPASPNTKLFATNSKGAVQGLSVE